MDPNLATVLVVIIFALVLVGAIVVYPRLKASIKGPFNTGLDVDGSPGEIPMSQAAIKAEDIKSSAGGVMADDKTGRGVDVKRVEAKDDILLSSAPPKSTTDPKAKPPA